MMKLVCTIGTQGLPGGGSVSRGDVYEVDDEHASTFIAQGNATLYVEPVVVNPQDVVEEVDASEIAHGESHASHFSGDVKESATTTAPKKKTTTKRR